MTCIEITASEKDLEELRLLSEKAFRDNKIQAKIDIYHTVQAVRLDGIDSEQFLPTLQVIFSGVIAIVQVINLVISIQEKKEKLPNFDNKSFLRINIKASNDRALDLTISGVITEEKAEFYHRSIRDFIDDFLSIEDEQDLRRLGSSEMAKINFLFKQLEIGLTDIRIQLSSVTRDDNKTAAFSVFEKINLIEAIKIGTKETFYLKIDDVSCCNHIFYVLERENILSFHEESTNVRMIQVESELIGFVGFTIEILPLFIKIISDKNCELFSKFK